MGEEEVLEEDPVIEEDFDFDLHRPKPSVADVDAAGAEPVIDLDLQQDSEMAPAAIEIAELSPPAAAASADGVAEDAVAVAGHPMPPLARNCQPGRRHGQHEKSFFCGIFFIKFRDDRSELYPERVPSWTVTCPVHEDNCATA